MKKVNKATMNQRTMWEERLTKKFIYFLSLYMAGQKFNIQHFKDIISIIIGYFNQRDRLLVQKLYTDNEDSTNRLVILALNKIQNKIRQNSDFEFPEYVLYFFNCIIDIATKEHEESTLDQKNQHMLLLFREFSIELDCDYSVINKIYLFACKIFYEILKQDFKKILLQLERQSEDILTNTWYMLLTEILPHVKSELVRAEIISNLIYSFSLDIEPSILFQIERTFPLFIIRYCNEGITKTINEKILLQKTLDKIFLNPEYTKGFVRSILHRSHENRDVFALLIKILTFYKPKEPTELFFREVMKHMLSLAIDEQTASFKILFSQVITGLIDLKYNQFFRSISFSSDNIGLDNYNAKLLNEFLNNDIVKTLKVMSHIINNMVRRINNNNRLMGNTETITANSLIEVSPYYCSALEGNLEVKDIRDNSVLNEKISSLALHFISRYPQECTRFIETYPCFAFKLFDQLLKLGGAVSYDEKRLSAVVTTIIKTVASDKKQELATKFLDFISTTYDISSLKNMPEICTYYSKIYDIMTKNNCIFFTNYNTVEYSNYFHQIQLSNDQQTREYRHANLIEFERLPKNLEDSLEISISSI